MLLGAAFLAVIAVSAIACWFFPRMRDAILVASAVAFIAVQDLRSAIAVSVLSVAAYFVSQRLQTGSRWPGRLVMLTALGFLAYFKYYPPIHDALVHAPRAVVTHAKSLATLASGTSAAGAGAAVAIPLGASYFTFKLIHYLVDSSRKQVPAHRPVTFFGYMLFLPMFTAGPIQRFDEYLRDRAERVSQKQLIDGGTRVAYGLIKKLVVVDLLLDKRMIHDTSRLFEAIPFIYVPCKVEQLILEGHTIHPLFVWQFVIHQFTQWYLDFSAYSDIAIGCALFFGIKLTENFDWPLFAPNPTEFWKRYHMSLSAFCQRYVYLPVMGRTRNPYLAVYATMMAMGLWHAGNLNYLAWGAYHATVLAIYLTWGRIRRARKWKTKNQGVMIAGTFATALAVCASAVFPATSELGIGAAGRLLIGLVGIHPR